MFHARPAPPALRLVLSFLLALVSISTLRAQDAAVGPHVTASGAAQMQALTSIKQSKTATQQKIDSRLYLGLLHLQADARLATLTAFRFLKPDGDGRIPVDVLTRAADDVPAIAAGVAARGGQIVRTQATGHIVQARVRFEDLEALAARPEVVFIRPSEGFRTHAVNVSEGATTHGAIEARAFFGTTGTGVKVGVISNGVDGLAAVQAAGDLPAVTVLAGQAGTGNEGTAMLEIVHDVAPDAQLYYATALSTQAQFAQNILDLAAAGCQIIVDDVLYYAEPAYQDGPVAQAVNTVTSNGVLYFSSAGNEGNLADGTSGTWEGDFVPNGTIGAIPGPAHNFGDGGQSIAVTHNSDVTVLSWSEHTTVTAGFASTDYDIYDMNAALTQIFDSSTNVQNGSGGDDFPVEIMSGAFTGERLVVTRFAAGATSSAPAMNLITFGGTFASGLATTGATRGHSAAAQAFSVAATPAKDAFDPGDPTGPYPGLYGPASLSERFSSDGPRRILLRPDGSELTPGNRTKTGGVVRQKPDITAADGVSCFASGFETFFGTSAAAPHAAAIAALIKSALPGITPAQVRNALVGSAIDIETAGTDIVTGAGIVMAHAALDRAGAVGGLAPRPMEVDAHAVAGDSSNHNGVLEPGETVQVAPAWKNNQAGPQPLNGSAAQLTGPAGPTYTLTDGTASYGTIASTATGSCATSGDCYLASVAGARPAAHWDATFTETLSTTLPKLWRLHVGNTFADVPSSNPFYPFVENLFHNGVTGGCGGGGYCPGNAVTRAQMAVFLLKGKHGAAYIPPACTGTFPDVSCAASAFAADWIEQLAAEAITGGCGGGLYCPNNPVTRAQMAIFLLKAEHGSAYTPPNCTGVFPDVACSPTKAFAVDWIEQLFHEGITGGCAGGGYCPGNPVLRSQMAVFLVKTFGLALYGP